MYTYIYIYIILYVGIHIKNKARVIYPYIPSAIQHVPHNDDIPIPILNKIQESAQLLGSRLAERQMLSKDTTYSWY